MKKINIFILLLLSIILFSCSKTYPTINLNDGWSWHVGSKYDTTENTLYYDFSPIQPSQLVNLDLLLQDGFGYIWLKKSITITEQFYNNPLAIYLGRITMADEAYLDGKLIGKTGRFEPNWWSDWNQVRSYSLPSNLQKKNEEHILLVKIFVGNEGSFSENKFISDQSYVQHVYKKEMFINSIINLISSFLMIVICIYHLLIYFKRKQERENLYFSVLCLLSALYLSNFFINSIPFLSTENISYVLFQKITTTSILPIITWFLSSFVIAFLKVNEKKIVYACRLILMIVPVIISIVIPTYAMLHHLRPLLQYMLIPTLLYTIVMVLKNAFINIDTQIKKDARILLFGISPVIIFSLLDIILHSILKFNEFPYLSGLSFPIIILSLLFILAGRFVQSRIEAEDLNLHLEQKVRERTQELSIANENLNLTLKRLEHTKKIADIDMRMAQFVQTSFYPQEPPKSENWDIAFSFKPMSGVAGDLYDFYTIGNEVSGVGLFDVSGHGIAAGLVTMLAKSIIYRNVINNKHKKLSQILELINNDIIHEKGDIENYITGILLRFNNDIVEYVNAGHTELLYKKANSNFVAEVNYPDKDFKSRFLGIDGLCNEFEQIKFRIKKDDILVLFTDCVIESKNAKKEEYGIHRLKDILAFCTNDSATEILSTILKNQSMFVGSEPLTDDFTIIVLKRKKD